MRQAAFGLCLEAGHFWPQGRIIGRISGRWPSGCAQGVRPGRYANLDNRNSDPRGGEEQRDMQMVLEVLAHIGQVVQAYYTRRCEFAAQTYSSQNQDLWRADSTRTQHHLLRGRDRLHYASVIAVFDAGGRLDASLVGQRDARDQRVGNDRQVGPVFRCAAV